MQVQCVMSHEDYIREEVIKNEIMKLEIKNSARRKNNIRR